MNNTINSARKVIGWNINQRSGLGKAIPQFVIEELIHQDADIIVLTEMYKCENLASFWNRMKAAGYDHAISNNEITNEVAILWKDNTFVLDSEPQTIITAKDNLNPNFLRADLRDSDNEMLSVVGYRIRIGFGKNENEYVNRAKQMKIVMEQLEGITNPMVMVTDSNNLRRGAREKKWNLGVLDSIVAEKGFYRNTPAGSSIYTENSSKGEEYEFAEDHIIGKGVKVSGLQYDRDFVLREKSVYVWGRNFCNYGDPSEKYKAIAPGYPDHAIVKGYYEIAC
jgi:hypothetical protein